jgi:uncharacterized protein (DUF2267 family)
VRPIFNIGSTAVTQPPAAHREDISSVEAAAFEAALSNAKTQADSDTFRPDRAALERADDAWVNMVALSEQLQKPGLSQEQQDAVFEMLSENLRVFREESKPLLEKVDGFIAAAEARNADSTVKA